jgi:hypothetical protein
MGALSKILSIGLLSVVAACGGPSDSPPTPLSRHFDDMYIAQIPLDQKQSVVQTQNEWSIAKMENAKAEADLNEVNAQLSIVNNDYKSTRLTVDSAVAAKKSAEASADVNRINTAKKDLHAAEAASKAAQTRIKYYEAYRDYLKKHHRFTQENMYWREAQYELAKAQVAQRNNISPRNNQYSWFPEQESERNKRVASARSKAEAEKGKAQSAREEWLKQQQNADRETGRQSSLPDPMAPRAATTVPIKPPAPSQAPLAPAPMPMPAPAPAPAPTPTPAPGGGT